MHVVKRLTIRSSHNTPQSDTDVRLQEAKARLMQRFQSLAAKDEIFSSLFTLRKMLGVGSFGMVMQAEAACDITAERLLNAQESKMSAEGAIGQRLARRRSLEKRSDAVVLPRGQSVAVKFEYNIDQQRRMFQLIKEHDVLVELFNCYGDKLEGFPEPYLFGCLGSSTFTDEANPCGLVGGSSVYHCYHFMAMEMLGENIRARFDNLPTAKSASSTAFPVEFVFDIGKQLLTRLMMLHAAPISVTHNDLKLDQLMLGCGDKKNTLYLVDFGLSLKYKKGVRVRWGNRRYASRFRLQGVNSPLTDLESTAYIVARFLHNDFPWDGLQCTESAKKYKMAAVKTQLWNLIDRVRRGRCLKTEAGQPAWMRHFFTDRTDAAGCGGPQLLRYMSKLSEYCARGRTGHLLAAEAIDYNYLFNCFVKY